MLIIGLGNPTAQYANNRHNIGFLLIDAIAKKFETDNNWQKKFKGEYTDFSFKGEKIRLLKPQTYMNLSGASAIEAANFYKVPLEEIVVIHDELDLPLCKLKTKQGGGDGGHNGLKSLDKSIGQNYYRLRFGIGHPGEKSKVHSYVLSDFTKDEFSQIDKIFEAFLNNIQILLLAETTKDGLQRLMTKIALDTQPPKEKKIALVEA